MERSVIGILNFASDYYAVFYSDGTSNVANFVRENDYFITLCLFNQRHPKQIAIEKSLIT